MKPEQLFPLAQQCKQNIGIQCSSASCKLCDQKSLILQVFFAQVSPHEDFCQVFKVSTDKTECQSTKEHFDNQKCKFKKKTKQSQVQQIKYICQKNQFMFQLSSSTSIFNNTFLLARNVGKVICLIQLKTLPLPNLNEGLLFFSRSDG